MVLISKEMNDLMNKQIVEELHSSYIYLGISQWAEERSLHHYAAWMMTQAKEEYEHASKFIKYITETGGHVEFGTLEAVKTDYANIEETIRTTIAHEEFITKKIRSLMDLAQEKKDYKLIGIVFIGFVIIRLLPLAWELALVGRVILFSLIGILLMSTAFIGRSKK